MGRKKGRGWRDATLLLPFSPANTHPLSLPWESRSDKGGRGKGLQRWGRVGCFLSLALLSSRAAVAAETGEGRRERQGGQWSQQGPPPHWGLPPGSNRAGSLLGMLSPGGGCPPGIHTPRATLQQNSQ